MSSCITSNGEYIIEKKYYEIYQTIQQPTETQKIGRLVAIVESLGVAKHFCAQHPDAYYIEQTCFDVVNISSIT